MANHETRIALLRKEMGVRGLDSFLVTNETNVSYLSGFEGKDSSILITRAKKIFLTDSRYIEEAKSNIKTFDIELISLSNYEILKELIQKNNLKKIGFESMDLPYEVAKRLKGMIGRSKLAAVKGLVEAFRAVKDAKEIGLIKDSIRLTQKVLKKVLSEMRPGVSEKSLSAKVEVEFINAGGHPGFPPIVACGANSSKPHAHAGDTKIKNDSFVMVDIGCCLNQYNSDCTRMVLLGKVKGKFKKIYNIVYEARKIALDMIRPGIQISEVDLAARRHIEKNGFGRFFGHSLGHGIGLEVHEKPAISRLNQDTLKPGMVFTVEPAIYIPRFGGARIEDMVLVTEDGYEILTR